MEQYTIDLQNLIQNVKIDQKRLLERISPTIQDAIIDLIRPDDEELKRWKTSNGGKEEFRQYLWNCFEKKPTYETVEFLWEFYQGNKRGRNQSVIKEFSNLFITETMECNHCETKIGQFEVDHIIPISKSGKDELGNLQILCQNCNRKKAKKFDFKKISIQLI